MLPLWEQVLKKGQTRFRNSGKRQTRAFYRLAKQYSILRSQHSLQANSVFVHWPTPESGKMEKILIPHTGHTWSPLMTRGRNYLEAIINLNLKLSLVVRVILIQWFRQWNSIRKMLRRKKISTFFLSGFSCRCWRSLAFRAIQST